MNNEKFEIILKLAFEVYAMVEYRNAEFSDEEIVTRIKEMGNLIAEKENVAVNKEE